MLGIAGLLCFCLGAISIGLHIWSHLPASGPTALSTQVNPVDAAMLLFLGVFLSAIGALFFDARSFGRLSSILKEYVPSGANWSINLPALPPASDKALDIPFGEVPMRVTGPFVFVSYSHEDEVWRKTLMKWLSGSLSQRGWSVWADDRIAAGYDWTPQLEWAIDHSSIALCLVTQSFVASEFISSKELPALRQRPENARFGIDWIPITAAMVEAVQLNQVQALWSPSVPVATLEPHQQQEALREIVLKLLRKAASMKDPAPDPPEPKRI